MTELSRPGRSTTNLLATLRELEARHVPLKREAGPGIAVQHLMEGGEARVPSQAKGAQAVRHRAQPNHQQGATVQAAAVGRLRREKTARSGLSQASKLGGSWSAGRAMGTRRATLMLQVSTGHDRRGLPWRRAIRCSSRSRPIAGRAAYRRDASAAGYSRTSTRTGRAGGPAKAAPAR